MKWLWFSGAVFLIGCSPFYHIKQACKKDPSLCDPEVKIDTVTKIKTVEKLTTVTKIKNDTTYIYKNKDSVIVKIQFKDSVAYIEADCPPNETQIIERPKIVYKTVEKPLKWLQKGFIFVGIFAVAVLLFWLISKIN